ncbi:MAG: hypothetical protein V3S29_05375 [bacterium]
MATADLTCWNCGQALAGVPLPVGRGEECPKCIASIRACLGCDFHDPDAHNACRETMADSVADKEKANTCDYFRPAKGAGPAADQGEADAARAKLDGLFGKTGKPGPGAKLADEVAALGEKSESEAEAARRKLEGLFGGPVGKKRG